MSLVARLVGLILFSFSFVLHADNLSVEQVQKFIGLSGLGKSIESMPEQFRQQARLQALLDEDKLTAELVQSAIENALNETSGYAIAETYLLERSDADQLNETIAFMESNVGGRIVAAENAAQNPDAQTAMQAYAMELAQTPPSDKRQQLIRDFLVVTDAENAAIDMLKTMMFVTADFMSEYKPEAGEVLQSSLETEWQKMEPMVRAQMGQYMQIASYYSYKDITDADLEQYITFLGSDAGKVYSEASLDIYQAYVNEIVRKMLANVIEASEQS